ncbi:MAG: hypothetical protein ABJB12_02785 [Pseudomonadota bacterium]
MKKCWSVVGLCSVLGLVLLPACSAGAGPSVEVSEASATESQREALVPNALSWSQTKAVLRLIDDICGDTWCDGDYDFAFRRLTCSNTLHTCTLTLQAFPVEGVPAAQKSYWRACKTSGFSGFASLVNTAPNGYQSLTDAYYDVLGECISRVEGNLH